MVDGKKIRSLREAANIKQVDLADCTGVSQKMISLIESGIRQPSAISLKLIAERLGVTMDELMAAAD